MHLIDKSSGSYPGKNTAPDLFTIKCFFRSWYLLHILHANYFVPNNQSKKSCPFLLPTYLPWSTALFFIKKNPDPTSKKNSSRLKKKKKKTMKCHLTAIQLKKNTVPNQMMHLIQSYRQFAMFLSIKLLHSFKITTKCTK